MHTQILGDAGKRKIVCQQIDKMAIKLILHGPAEQTRSKSKSISKSEFAFIDSVLS